MELELDALRRRNKELEAEVEGMKKKHAAVEATLKSKDATGRRRELEMEDLLQKKSENFLDTNEQVLPFSVAQITI